MSPLIDFTNPVTILVATVLFVLTVFLGKETKRSAVIVIMLAVFLITIAGHSVEFSLAESLKIQNTIATSITFDFIFILLSFMAYLWIDDIEAKDKKKKSIDDSLNWFWTKV